MGPRFIMLDRAAVDKVQAPLRHEAARARPVVVARVLAPPAHEEGDVRPGEAARGVRLERGEDRRDDLAHAGDLFGSDSIRRGGDGSILIIGLAALRRALGCARCTRTNPAASLEH